MSRDDFDAIISFFQEDDQKGSPSPSPDSENFLGTALIVFQWAKQEHLKAVVDFVTKQKRKTETTEWSPLSDNPF